VDGRKLIVEKVTRPPTTEMFDAQLLEKSHVGTPICSFRSSLSMIAVTTPTNRQRLNGAQRNRTVIVMPFFDLNKKPGRAMAIRVIWTEL
jgi:hypothetical protein